MNNRSKFIREVALLQSEINMIFYEIMSKISNGSETDSSILESLIDSINYSVNDKRRFTIYEEDYNNN